MDSVYKVHSVQSETLSTTQNLLDFDIPDGQVFDLSKSYLSINARVAGGSAQANHSTAIFNVSGALNSGNNVVADYQKSIALVKNSRLTSQVKGKIEEIRDVDLLRSFLDNVYEPQSVFLGQEYNNLMGIRTYEMFGNISPLIDVSAETGSTARYIDKNIKIPFSELLNVGQVKQFDTRRLGKCRLSLELNMDKLSARGDNYNENYFSALNNGTLLNITGGASGTPITSAVLAQGGGAAAKTYDQDYQEHIPYYVGMPVKTTNGKLDGTAGDMAQAFTTISDIQYDGTTGQITLSFSDSLGTVANTKTSADIKIGSISTGDITGMSIALSQAELVMYSLGSNNMGNVASSVNFTTYKVERDNGSNNTTFKRQYELEPECINAIVLLKAHQDAKFSDNVPDGGTRVAINNELTTDRLIDSNNPIYFNQLNKFALNQGKEIKNVIGRRYARTGATTEPDRGTDSALAYIVEPQPITNNMKLVEFEINDTGGVGDISIYKEVLSSL